MSSMSATAIVSAPRPSSRQSSSPRYTVVLPPRPSTTVYIRRRLLAGALAIAIAVVGWAGAGNVLANREGVPASTLTVRPESSYVVRSGDTMWSIADRFRGDAGQLDYVDALIAANGGSELQVGQRIQLP